MTPPTQAEWDRREAEQFIVDRCERFPLDDWTERDVTAAYLAALAAERARWEKAEPGQYIASGDCPACGMHLVVEHGDEPGEVAFLSGPSCGR